MFGQGAWHSSSTGLHTARAACLHLKSRRPDFPQPCCLDAFMPDYHGHLPSTAIHTQGWKSRQLYQTSHMWLLWGFHQEASPTQGLQCTSGILAGHSCTILPLPCHLHSSDSSNSSWPGSSSVSVIFSWSKDCLSVVSRE